MKDIGRILLIDDCEYLIVSVINYDGETYFYLMSANSPLRILLAKEKNLRNGVMQLTIINNDDEKKFVYELFLKGARLGLL